MRSAWLIIFAIYALHVRCQSCFNQPQSYFDFPSPRSIIATDLNKDGLKDLVLCSALGLHVRMNNSGSFGAFTTYTAPGFSPNDLTAPDLNADGYPDIVSVKNGTLYVHLNNGSGGLLAPSSYTVSGASGLNMADINEDGYSDLLISAGALRVVFGTGSGSISASTAFGGQGAWLTTGDFNGDSHIDVAACGASLVTVWFGTGLSLSAPQTIPLTTSYFNINSADLNADGKSDLIISGGVITVMLATGTNSFLTLPSFTVSGNCTGPVGAADLNGDGFTDLAAVRLQGAAINLLYGDGTGQFKNHFQQPASTRSTANSLICTDFNNNGKPDIASIHMQSNELVVLTDCQTVGLNDNTIRSVLLFPNPASGDVVLESEIPVTRVTVFSMHGQQCAVFSGAELKQLDVQSLPKGIYLVKIATAGSSVTKKLVIAR